jgi:hypothetical protein
MIGRARNDKPNQWFSGSLKLAGTDSCNPWQLMGCNNAATLAFFNDTATTEIYTSAGVFIAEFIQQRFDQSLFARGIKVDLLGVAVGHTR